MVRAVKIAVILAAGKGERLRALSTDKPKPLFLINHFPMLQYVIDALKKAEICNILLVVGYRKRDVKEYFGNGSKYKVAIRYVENKEYSKGSAISLYCVRHIVNKNEPFIVLNADHIINPRMLKRLLNYSFSEQTSVVMCYDRSLKQTPDDMKIVLRENTVVKIGKDIACGDGVYTGVCLCMTSDIFEGLRQAIDKDGENCAYEMGIMRLIKDNFKVEGCDVSGINWIDVDIPEEVKIAERIVKKYYTKSRM